MDLCCIHDLLRDLSTSEARQINFFGINSDNDATSSSTSLRRVALYRNVDEYVTINCSTATLRSMLWFSYSIIHLSKLLNKVGKLLRVLYVEAACLQENKLPKEIGEEVHLSSHHKALSDAIEKWCSLRSLSLRNSSSIPPFVSFAHHLNLYKMFLHGRIKNLPKMPPDLAKLTLNGSQLQQDAIETLEKLRNLQVLRLEQEPYCSEKMICSSGGFPHLEFLVLDSSNLKEWIVEEGGFPCLEFLELNCSNIKEGMGS
ncbi:LOW QUALITY PROTEIN: putative disease resistance protein [Cinnamomum micranthum f. kanehirae]|uniref:Putative disease resistance protein n=1 Tax=Cinnamomum micranthum f. kanehirae TaxID=337451 RepID=A0A443NEH9_9MAGN|nr:LOW QUALITY PROTEIN: putative disease resistance protein [Cinnamomum micranthum f. kanehirae]